jgi:putative PEP-CTERM system histidine kinase
MPFSLILSYSAVIVTGAAAVTVIWRGPKAFVHRTLAAGLALFSLEALFVALTFQAASPTDALHLQRLQLLISSLVPGIWILFSLSIGRPNYGQVVSKWKWAIGASFVLPVILDILFSDAFFSGPSMSLMAPGPEIGFGWSGSLLHLWSLIGSTIVLMNLEKLLRSSTGTIRWQIKFLVVAVGGLFMIRVFTDSQALLFRALDMRLHEVNLTALLLADVVMARSFVRTRILDFDVYLSHSFLYNSLTFIMVGIYLITVAIVGRIAYYFDETGGVPLTAFFLLPALTGLALLLLSDRLRLLRKRFIARHFKRPHHDYRNLWMDFTQKTASVLSVPELSATIAKLVSQTLEILSVSVWLVDGQREGLVFGASNVFSEAQAGKLKLLGQNGKEFLRGLAQQDMPVDFGSQNGGIAALREEFGDCLREAAIRYCLPLRAGGEFIGLLTLDKKVGRETRLDVEDLDLMKTIGDQAAASLLNARLVERVRQAKELEAFQVMSAFFMHDLKNLASRLSLVTENLPIHFDDPEFRDDALQTIAHSVEKVNKMCNRLSLLGQKLELKPRHAELDRLVGLVLSDMRGELRGLVVTGLTSGATVLVDEEQMQKVFANLLLNANEAIGQEGRIEVRSSVRDGWAGVSIADNGCGIAEEFMEKHMFRPFQTTKKQGMGIGLFHCKTIVEAHGGRMEVESEDGKGSTFRVLLPVGTR